MILGHLYSFRRQGTLRQVVLRLEKLLLELRRKLLEDVFSSLVVGADKLEDVKFETHDVLKVDVPMLIGRIPDPCVKQVFWLLRLKVLVIYELLG